MYLQVLYSGLSTQEVTTIIIMFPQSFEEEVLCRLNRIEKLLQEKPLTSVKAVKQETDHYN